MTWFAIKDGQRVLRCVEQAQAPSEPHAVISPWVGLPPGGALGRELREASGVLYWHNNAEAAWAGARTRRDALLLASDWITVRAMETGQPVPTAWATYRQALRDITAQPDPFNLTWPAAPA